AFLTPLYKKVKGKVVITRASCSTSPSVVDASIHDAVIYCKNSLEEQVAGRSERWPLEVLSVEMLLWLGSSERRCGWLAVGRESRAATTLLEDEEAGNVGRGGGGLSEIERHRLVPHRW
ncbi:hypothetical protein B296_00054530, partial [Ensete ventricosum]